jgi:hypothetical protein
MSRDSYLLVGQRVSWTEDGLQLVGRVTKIHRGDPPSATAETEDGRRITAAESLFYTWYEGWL